MSQSDSFIDEVTEEVRRDRLYASFRKYGWMAALAVLVIVGGASYYEYSRAQDQARSEAFGDTILTALEKGGPALRADALGEVSAESADGAAIVGLAQAAEMAQSGDLDGAVEVLTGVSQSNDIPVVYRALAKFRALTLQAGTLSPEERRAEYEEIAGAGSPLRLLAMEQIAVTYMEEGNRDEALARLRGLEEEAGLTPDLLRRISQLIVVLGETPGGADTAADG